MICPNCGKESPGKFCPACGTKMPAAEVQTPVMNVPEPAVPDKADEAVQQADAVAAAVSAAVAAEIPAAPEPPAPAPDPVPAAPNQGWAPNQAMPNPGCAPYPNQAPGYAAPNQGYAPNHGYSPNQGYAPNQPMPNPGYAPYPNQGPDRNYVPAQGNNPGAQAVGAYNAPAVDVGKTPASQVVRKAATSGAWIVATLATTLAFLITLYLNVFDKSRQSILYYIENLPRFKGTEYESQILSSIVSIAGSLLLSLIFVLLLWKIFGSAASKKNEKMGTGPLTLMKVFFIITLIGVCIALTAAVILGVVTLILGSDAEFSADVTAYINEFLRQYDLQLSSVNVSAASLVAILFGVLAVVLVFALIFVAKVLKSLSTGKRVIRTGQPDDRVSVFVAIFSILAASVMIICGISFLFAGGLSWLLSGIVILLNAIALICFAAVIFKFRSGMRRLGVRKGVMQRPA